MKRILFVLLFAIFAVSGTFQYAADAGLREIEEKLSQIAEESFQSVVVITTKRTVNVPDNPWDMLFDSPYFEQFRKRFPRNPKSETPLIQGGGSGFIIDENGYIITNNHVISGNNEIIVRLNDKTEYKAEIVGADPKTDLAVLKIKSDKKLSPLKLADSDKVKIGQFCIAVGAPFMFDYTMTFGIVSQKGRTVGLNFYENYIQTDAAINMGNSGGPLLDLDGKVIGVNDFIVSGNAMSPGNIGLGFAIPSNMVKKVYEQIKEHGKVIRPWVGIGMEEITQKQKSELKIKSGVLVKEIYDGQPADKAGIEPGDIILKVGNKEVNSPKDVQNAVLEYNPGDTIEFEVFRNNKKKIIKVKASQQADNITAMLRGENRDGLVADFGLAFATENGKVIIGEVRENSEAELLQIEPGMQVLSVNGKKVNSLDEAEQAVTEKKNELSLVISDGVSKRIITIKKK